MLTIISLFHLFIAINLYCVTQIQWSFLSTLIYHKLCWVWYLQYYKNRLFTKQCTVWMQDCDSGVRLFPIIDCYQINNHLICQITHQWLLTTHSQWSLQQYITHTCVLHFTHSIKVFPYKHYILCDSLHSLQTESLIPINPSPFHPLIQTNNPNQLHLQSSSAPSSSFYALLSSPFPTSATQTSCYCTVESTSIPSPSRSSFVHTPPRLARSVPRSPLQTLHTESASPGESAAPSSTTDISFSALPPFRHPRLKTRSKHCRYREAVARQRGSTRKSSSKIPRKPTQKAAIATLLWLGFHWGSWLTGWAALAAWAGTQRGRRRADDCPRRRDWVRRNRRKSTLGDECR